MPVKKGLATWAGLVAAVGQYAAAVAVFLAAPDPELALGPLATATATLWKVIEGRMNQATAHAARAPAPFSFTTSTGEGFSSATVKPLRRIDQAATLGQPEDTSLEVPGGGVLPDGTRA